MKLTRLDIKPICVALIAAGILSACGGGGGDGPAPTTPGTTNPDTGTTPGGTTPGGTTPGGTTPGGTTPGGTTPGGTTPGGTTPGGTTPGGTTPGGTTPGGTTPGGTTPSGATTMSCPEGAGFQCSGSTVLARENGVILTNSGVQTYGVSTSDLANPILVKTGASGFELPSATSGGTAGVAEARVAKNAAGTVAAPILLLRNLGLTWDGTTERPPILETFNPTAGITRLNAAGAVVTTGALPGPSDLAYYNWATLGARATQENYANNRYFPRSAPSRCAPDVPPANCPTAETTGPRSVSAGDWRTGGIRPDVTSFVRLHEDGDIHGGNGPNDANGNPTILEGGNGFGIPFPGSKGYRSFDNWSYQYTNLSTWLTQDTVVIEEWARLGNEHNKNRRGTITYGEVTDPATIPTTGTASYTGFVYGWHAPTRASDPSVFYGTATMTVNFVTRQVTVAVQNTATYDAANTPVPATFTTTMAMGAATLANYMTAPVSSGGFTGGVSARYFGPVAAGGPAEIGGTFQLTGGGQTTIGGFMGRRQ